MRRVLIIGSGGAGKSTLARRLGARTGLPVIHLDAHYWTAGWGQTPKPEWEAKVAALSAGETWIMDGNYGGTMEARIAAADTIVLMQMSRWRCVANVFARWWRTRGRVRADLAPGCPEQWPSLAFLLWIWRYPERSLPAVRERLGRAGAGKTVVILRTPRDVRAWLASLAAA